MMIADVKGRKCNQCRKGCGAGEPATFAPWCPGCQAKLAVGLRTGNEPPAERWHFGGHRKRLSQDDFAKLGKAIQARKEERVVLPGARRA